ncbi:hypothetical protein DES53_104221 [Roseimicrobium gellanilyticum]|uniref:Uncharacterized protein n=1 Tax=Roseimicrobium gellanilyticum TaxID=748857 RepID=A0A366HPF6_9BACT|nr:hypothetical protein DES53_104221 [Roseimicrobium gellanilyticum]
MKFPRCKMDLIADACINIAIITTFTHFFATDRVMPTAC